MPARILVIEDNTENLDLMSYLLEAFGHTTLTARDGEEGLAAVRRHLPDLIVCDIQMPGLDGFGVARAVRLDARLARIPLVAVTAFAMRDDRERVLAAGFDGYITKPIVPEEFVGQVEAFLPAEGSHTGVTAGRDSDPVPSGPWILAVDNSPVNLSVVRSTLEPFGYRVTTANSVKGALAIARENAPDLILSDLHMPEADGYDFLKIVKADPNLSVIPFAIISSTVWRETDPALALSLGAAQFILRPIEPRELVAAVEAALAGKIETAAKQRE
jgi:two-component system cell cycle response regulator